MCQTTGLSPPIVEFLLTNQLLLSHTTNQSVNPIGRTSVKNLKQISKLLIVGVLAVMPALLSIGPSQEWFDRQKSQAARIQQDFLCMREVLWYESRSDNEAGKRAVASVVLNRVESKRFPDGICAVVQQRMQFSYRNALKNRKQILEPKPKVAELQKYELVQQIAWEVASGNFKRTLPKDVLWYHVHRVNPIWNSKMKRVTVAGSKHIFLKGSDRG